MKISTSNILFIKHLESLQNYYRTGLKLIAKLSSPNQRKSHPERKNIKPLLPLEHYKLYRPNIAERTKTPQERR